MTLERHRSKLIPDVDFNLEGRLFVTDNEGTFPIRGGGKSRDKLPGPDAFQRPSMVVDDVQSFRSYDPRRAKERKYKPKEPSRFGQEVADLPNATWGSGASKSLQRKLRKKKRQKEIDYYNTRDLNSNSKYGTYEAAKSNWSLPSKKKKKKKVTPGGSVGRQRTYRSLDLQAMRKYQKQKRKAGKRGSFQEIYGISNGRLPLMDGRYGPAKEQRKTIHEEKLPGLLFILTGSLIFIIGVVKLLTCWWHQYFYALWTGLLILLQGVLGAYHRGDYLTEWLNGLYITIGIAASTSTLAATFLSLHVLIPIITRLGLDQNPEFIAQNLNVTNRHESLAIDTGVETMVFLNMGFDISCLVLALVSYFCATATMVCIGNHWDAVYRSTGECDYRGTPRFFNPLEQLSLGQATFLFGCLAYELKQSGENTYLSSIWVAGMIIIAGLFSFFSLKRIDLSSMGMFSMFIEFLAVVACSGATVLTILALSDEASLLDEASGDQAKLHTAAAVFDGFFLFCMLLNVVYCVGIIFRNVRKLCCYECWHGPPAPPDQTYA